MQTISFLFLQQSSHYIITTAPMCRLLKLHRRHLRGSPCFGDKIWSCLLWEYSMTFVLRFAMDSVALQNEQRKQGECHDAVEQLIFLALPDFVRFETENGMLFPRLMIPIAVRSALNPLSCMPESGRKQSDHALIFDRLLVSKRPCGEGRFHRLRHAEIT